MRRNRFVIDLTAINDGVYAILMDNHYEISQSDSENLVADLVEHFIYKMSTRSNISPQSQKGVKHHNFNINAIFRIFCKYATCYKNVDSSYEHCLIILKFIVDELDYLLNTWCLSSILDGEIVGNKLKIDAVVNQSTSE